MLQLGGNLSRNASDRFAISCFIAALALGGLSAPAFASVFGTSVPESQWASPGDNDRAATGDTNDDDASNDDELVTDGNTAWDDATITWQIEQLNSSVQYTYVFRDFGPGNGAGLSNIAISMSPDAIGEKAPSDEEALIDADALTNLQTETSDLTGPISGFAFDETPTIDSESVEFASDLGNTDVGAGVKFNVDDLDVDEDLNAIAIRFESNRLPMWADVTVKGGQVSLANDGIDEHGSATQTTKFLAAPNSVVPEPASATLLALGGLVLLRRRP